MLDGRCLLSRTGSGIRIPLIPTGRSIVYTPERQLTYQVCSLPPGHPDIIANTDFSTKALIDEYIESVYAQTGIWRSSTGAGGYVPRW